MTQPAAQHDMAWASDPTLPQLAQALDGAAMAAAFAPMLPGMTVQGCEIERVKLRPQRTCSVAYRLQLRSAAGDAFEQRVSARVCRGGESDQRYRQALAGATVRSAAGPALSHLPALDMIAHWWPNDPRLPACALLADDEAMRARVLPELAGVLTGGRGRLLGFRTTIVQVVPELRLCARVDLQLQPEPGAPAQSHAVYAKADLERDGGLTLDAMQALHDSPAARDGRLRLPQPLLWQPAHGLYWQRALPGRPLNDGGGVVPPALAAQVGAQLAVLHAVPLRGLPRRDAHSLLAQLDDSLALLGSADAAWQPAVQRVVGWLRAQAVHAALDSAPLVTLHGDLHPDNLLLDGPQLGLIDFDSLCRGAAVLELGAWAADTLYRNVLAGAAPPAAAPSWQALAAGYAQAQGSDAAPVDAHALAWSTVHALLCQRVHRCVAKRKPGRLAAVPGLLALAESITLHGRLDAVLQPWPVAA